MVNFLLTEEQVALKELCRSFGERQLQPIADELDRKASDDPASPFPWGALKEFSALGLKNLPLPEKWGGADMDVLTHCVLLEELMTVEAGFAATVHQSWKLAGLLAECGTDDQISRYIGAFSEDSEYLMGDGTLGPIASSEDLELNARPEGGGWALEGRNRFVGCGPIAKLLFMDAASVSTAPGSSDAVTFLVSQGTPGIRQEEIHDKMGARVFLESELTFDKCRVPVEDILSDGNESGAKNRYFRKIAPTLGAFGVGVARASLETSIAHCLERVQGGKPIFEHDVVSFRLAEMKVDVDVARDLVWRAAWHSDHPGEGAPGIGLSALLFASEMAPRVCDMGIQLFGGYGFMRDYPVQKYWRDSLMCLNHGDTHDMARLKLGRLIETEAI
jgi:alkylation response protein AidB-like acyl-CoA dehydrogenase